jgi:hypothetical protein
MTQSAHLGDDRHAASEPAAGPSYSGTVVLELGPGAGALVLRTPAALDGREIEISGAGTAGPRTHSAVRPRHVAGGIQHAAVYPDLPPGSYVVWTESDTPAVTVTVNAACVTTADWPDWPDSDIE